MTDATIVLGDYQQSLVVVRSLARSGRRVIVGQTSRRAASGLSRYAHEVWRHPEIAERRAFVDALERLLRERREIRAIFPVGQSELAALLDAPDRLATRAQLVMPRPAVIEVCLDKRRTYQLAADLGLPIAPTAVADDYEHLETHVQALGFPVVIKCPDSSRLIRGRKAVICRRADDLAHWRTELSTEQYPLLVQRFASGLRHNCQFAAADGSITAYFEQRVLRTDEPDHTGFGVEGISVAPSPALREQVAILVRRLCYHGVGCAQFLVDDPSGTYVFLELNPRLDATCELPYRCGIDLPRLALDPRIPANPAYPVGRRFHWFLGDARGVMRRVERHEIDRRAIATAARQSMAAHFRAHYRLTWDWSDPVPTLFLYGQALLALGRRAGRATRTAVQP